MASFVGLSMMISLLVPMLLASSDLICPHFLEMLEKDTTLVRVRLFNRERHQDLTPLQTISVIKETVLS